MGNWGAPPANFNKMMQPTVDFGPVAQEEFDTPPVTVTAPWVQSTTRIVCTPSGVATSDHDPDDYIVEGVRAVVQNIIPGVSFDLIGIAPGGTWGKYKISLLAMTPQ